MVTGDDEPADPDEGTVLSPDELDITNDEHVAEIEEGRYVVSPGDPIGDIPTVEDETETGTKSAADPSAEPESEPPEIDETAVHEYLESQFRDSGSRYGFDITATFDDSVDQRQMVSNDVVTIFESLVLWYAQQIDGKTPVEEVLGILMMEASVPVRYPPASLQRLLESTDLSPDDSIADLIAAVDSEDGFRI